MRDDVIGAEQREPDLRGCFLRPRQRRRDNLPKRREEHEIDGQGHSARQEAASHARPGPHRF